MFVQILTYDLVEVSKLASVEIVSRDGSKLTLRIERSAYDAIKRFVVG
jgi:hypothetical protein